VKNGQLGTDRERRFIFVWEGTVASLPDSRAVRALEWVDCHAGQWRMAVDRWKVDPLALKWMWSIMVRSPFRIDMVVTSRPPRFAKALTAKIEMENWPVRYVFATSADALGRQLPAMPDVERVVYGLEEHRWCFGPQGLSLSHAGQLI
jgi:hypothetical protein